MSAFISVLWFILAALCLFKGVVTLPPSPPSPPRYGRYLVCFQMEGGFVGNIDVTIQLPVTAERVQQLREYIKKHEVVEGRPGNVVITAMIVETAP